MSVFKEAPNIDQPFNHHLYFPKVTTSMGYLASSGGLLFAQMTAEHVRELQQILQAMVVQTDDFNRNT